METKNTTATAEAEELINEFNIADEISQETEIKNNSGKNSGTINKKDLLNDPDFNKDLLQDISDGDQEEDPDQLDDDQDDSEEKEDLMDASEFAEVITELADMLITGVSSFGFRKSLVNSEQYDYIKELLAYNGVNVSSRRKMSEYDLWHMRKHQEIEEYKKKDAPFTKKEGDLLLKQLRRYLKTKNFSVSPEGGVGIAFASIMAPRIMDIIINMMNKEYPPAEDPIANEMHDDDDPLKKKIRIEIKPT